MKYNEHLWRIRGTMISIPSLSHSGHSVGVCEILPSPYKKKKGPALTVQVEILPWNFHQTHLPCLFFTRGCSLHGSDLSKRARGPEPATSLSQGSARSLLKQLLLITPTLTSVSIGQFEHLAFVVTKPHYHQTNLASPPLLMYSPSTDTIGSRGVSLIQFYFIAGILTIVCGDWYWPWEKCIR